MGLTYKALKYRDIKMNMTKAKVDRGGGGVADGIDGGEMSDDQTSAIAIEANTTVVDAAAAAAAAMPDKQEHFTADHIMQLCLFLAEKSRAKQLQQNQEMNARRYYENFLKEANDFIEDDQMQGETQTQAASYQMKSAQIKQNSSITLQTSPLAARRTKIKSEKFLKQTVLTDNFSTTNSNFHQDTYEKSKQITHLHQHSEQQQPQDKRNILLKIRQQIFERKRLRQLLSGAQRQNGQYLQPQCHLQPVVGFDYSSAEMQAQDELQHLADVWRPW